MTRSETGFELSITRTFDAPLSLVWGIWADRAHVARWWAPKTFEVTGHIDWDFEVGGAYRIGITSVKNGLTYMGGRFVEIVPNQRIVFTFAWEATGDSIGQETLITVTFAEQNGRTTQTFHQTPFFNADSRDNHIGGWNEVFDREQTYLDNRK